MRVTPENIMSLKNNEVFIFGANLQGIHGRGAAKTALQWGAEIGVGEGLCGSTYALPTIEKLRPYTPLSVAAIGQHVDTFINVAKERRDLIFLVTEVGCGLCGYAPQDIAPLFKDAIDLENVYLPERFWEAMNDIPGS